MSPRRSPSSPRDDLPSAIAKGRGQLAGRFQSHPNPLKSTLSDSAVYGGNSRSQTQFDYHLCFQQLSSKGWRFFGERLIYTRELLLQQCGTGRSRNLSRLRDREKWSDSSWNLIQNQINV